MAAAPSAAAAKKKTPQRQAKKLAPDAGTPLEGAMSTKAPSAPESPAPAAPKHERPPTRARRRRRAQTTAGATEVVARRERAETRAPRRAVEPLSSQAEVLETDEAIVIRFPPVAPLPFLAPPPPPAVRAVPRAPRAVPPAPAAPAAPTAPAPPVTPPVARKEPTAVGPPRARKPAAEPPAVGEDRTLTRSQRRRLRRKRHRDKENHRPPPATSFVEPVAPELPAAPAAHERGRAAALGAALENGDFESSAALAAEREEAPPWLEDVEVIRAEAEESDTGEPEIIEPVREEPVAGNGAETMRPTAESEALDETALLKDKGRRRRRRGRRSTPHEAPEPVAAVGAVEAKAEAAAAARREMIINTVQREECRIAILEDGRLEEIYLERAAAENHVGNIYKGTVTNVEPSIQAAFIDFGQGKNGFLHISDLHPQYFPNGHGQTENVGRKMPRRSRPPIQRCLRRAQEVIVQVTKEGIGTKGPTLSTYLSIPGRFLVMMPGMRRLGVSRRIEDDDVRDKLRDLLGDLDLPEGMGFIARTAAVDHGKRELQNDLSYLTRLWKAVEKRIEKEPPPAELYRESDLVIRTIRDVFTHDIARIIVDDQEVLERAGEFLSIFSPRSQDIITLYADPEPIFHKYKIEAELERLHSRYVPLKSGGSLVIDQAEALVAIDVNSGRFRTEDDAEATAYKINCEAADEIPRQLRLRDLGGVIVCDFIDMRLESHRRDIERRLIENLKQHKERAKVLRTSAFGLIEMTRQRQRASLTRSVYRDCRHCRGTGLVKTVESVTLDVMRLIQLAVTREPIRMVEVAISPEVAYLLQNRKRALIYELETKYRRIVSIRPDPTFSLDRVEISCTDARGRVVPYT
jgi:ribonuclease E